MVLSNKNSIFTFFIRNYGVNVLRKKKGLPPRFAYSPLSETPEFSYLDGRGYSPLNTMQKKRFERDQLFAKKIIKHMNEYKIAKELVDNSKKNQ